MVESKLLKQERLFNGNGSPNKTTTTTISYLCKHFQRWRFVIILALWPRKKWWRPLEVVGGEWDLLCWSNLHSILESRSKRLFEHEEGYLTGIQKFWYQFRSGPVHILYNLLIHRVFHIFLHFFQIFHGPKKYSLWNLCPFCVSNDLFALTHERFWGRVIGKLYF